MKKIEIRETMCVHTGINAKFENIFIFYEKNIFMLIQGIYSPNKWILVPKTRLKLIFLQKPISFLDSALKTTYIIYARFVQPLIGTAASFQYMLILLAITLVL